MTPIHRTALRALPILLVLTAGGTSAKEASQTLTMSQAIDLAIKNGPQIRAAKQGVVATEERVRGAGVQRYPSLRVDANLQYWNNAVTFPSGAMMGGMSGGMMGGTGGMMGSSSIVVRDRLTWTASVTLTQPISGLFVLSRLVEMEKHGETAAHADQAQARLDTAQRAAEAYLRVLQATAAESIAAKSVQQVESQLARARVMEQGGAMGHVDVLRFISQLETARQAMLRARSGIKVASAALAVALDQPQSGAIGVVDDLPDPPPPLTWSNDDAAQMAVQGRPDIAAAHQRSEQALGNRALAKARLLPNVNAIGTAQHSEGQAFLPKNSWFVGATLSWDLWDWGKNWSGVKEAEARAAQAAIGVEVMQKQAMFDAERTLSEARTAYETIASAKAALEAAEEAYRIQSVRYSTGVATTTDIIAGEAELTRARIGYVQARYDVYLAQVAFARAIGKVPSTNLVAESRAPRSNK